MGLLSGMLGGKDETLPTMDKKTVEKSLKEALWPLLKQHGFQTFKGRKAWRHTEKRIDVVEIQFFPRGKADQWGITPYSFALPVGCFFPFAASEHESRIKREKELMLIDETQCHLRKTALKTLKQRECKITNIWYIDPKGKYLNAAVEDAKNLFNREIFAWFESFDNLPNLLKNLTETPDAHIALGLTLGAPRYLAGFLALETGEWSLAKKLLQQELDRGFIPPGLRQHFQSDDKFTAGIAKTETALNSQLSAGITKAEAALRGTS